MSTLYPSVLVLSDCTPALQLTLWNQHDLLSFLLYQCKQYGNHLLEFHLRDFSRLSEIQYHHGDVVAKGGAKRYSDAVAFLIEGFTDRHQIALVHRDVLVDRLVPDEGVVLFAYLPNPVDRVVDHRVRTDLVHELPHLLEDRQAAVLEHRHRVRVLHRAVLDRRLSGQVGDRLDRGLHLRHRQKGGEVGRVRRDEDEADEPPGARDDPTGNGTRYNFRAGTDKRGVDEEDALLKREALFLVLAVRRDAIHDEEQESDDDEADHDDHPDVGRERSEELEDLRLGGRLTHEKIELLLLEGLREIDGRLS